MASQATRRLTLSPSSNAVVERVVPLDSPVSPNNNVQPVQNIPDNTTTSSDTRDDAESQSASVALSEDTIAISNDESIDKYKLLRVDLANQKLRRGREVSNNKHKLNDTVESVNNLISKLSSTNELLKFVSSRCFIENSRYYEQCDSILNDFDRLSRKQIEIKKECHNLRKRNRELQKELNDIKKFKSMLECIKSGKIQIE